MAEECDLDIDDDLALEIDSKKTKQKDKIEIEKMKRELKHILSQPLFPKVNIIFFFLFYSLLSFLLESLPFLLPFPPQKIEKILIILFFYRAPSHQDIQLLEPWTP